MDEPVDEDTDADDLMFDLGLRYLRMKAAEKRINDSKKAQALSLWVKDAASRKALVDYVESVTDKSSPEKAHKVCDFCKENGWVPISMKNDWLTVFGNGVTKKN